MYAAYKFLDILEDMILENCTSDNNLEAICNIKKTLVLVD